VISIFVGLQVKLSNKRKIIKKKIKQNNRFMKKIILSFILFMLFGVIALQSQTPGLIVYPATGASKLVLDPNGDGYISMTTAGFLGNDVLNSEIPYHRLIPAGNEPDSDVQNGPNCGFTDFVESAAGSVDPAFHHSNGTHWFFRFRMADIKPNSKSYSILIDTDLLFGSADVGTYSASNPGFEIEIVLATNFGVFIYDLDAPCGSNLVKSYPLSRIQKAIAATTICNKPNYFLDCYVDWTDLTALFGITENTPMRYAIVDNMAANKSTICNLSSASDIGGVDDNSCGSFEDCVTIVVINQPPCPPSSPVPCVYSDCPSFSDLPLLADSTTVNGTSTEADGTLIRVYVNGLLSGTGTVSTGFWTATLSGALVNGDVVSATAQAAGEVESGTNCFNNTTVTETCTSPLVSALVSECNPRKGFSGAAGSAIPGAVIRVYDMLGNLYSPIAGSIYSAGTITVNTDGSWVWKCNSSNACAAGANNCIPSGQYLITQQVAGECESDPIYFCLGTATLTQTPVITTSPISPTTTSISGSVPTPDNIANDVTVILYVNGNQVASVATETGGSWTISGLTLNYCDTITARAVRYGATAKCLSNPSAGIVVSDISDTPVITGIYCGPISQVSGTSTESNGTVITVYSNGVPVGTTSVWGGVWTANVSPVIPVGNTITASSTNTFLCKTQSAISLGVTVISGYSGVAEISPNPIIESASTIFGTGIVGDVVTLYIDGWPLYLDLIETIPAVAVVDAFGDWIVTFIDSGLLYTGGIITLTTSDGGTCQSEHQDPTPISCVPPEINLVVSPDDAEICEENSLVNIEVASSQLNVIYQLYDNALNANTGSSVLGNGNSIYLSTSTLYQSTDISVLAIKFPFGECTDTLTEFVHVTVNNNPIQNLTVIPSSYFVCAGEDQVFISILNSELNVNYQLRDDSDNTPVGITYPGNGGILDLPAGLINTETTFNILATSTITPTFCSVELTNKATIQLNQTPSIFVTSTEDPLICGGNGSIHFSFANVPDGLYMIEYDGGFIDNVPVLSGSATVHLPAGIYNNISITVDCESTENPSVTLISPTCIIANDDVETGINGLTGATAIINVLDNDSLNGLPLLIADITLIITVPDPNNYIVLNPDGTVDVLPLTPPGTYFITYTICEFINPLNCDDAFISITVDAVPLLTVTKTADVGTYDLAGDVITYTIVVTNSGNVTLNNITVTDPLTGLNTTILSLAPGSSQTYTEVYTITQSDLDAGFVTNTATATDGVTTDTGSETVNAVQQPELTVTKTADVGTYDLAGDVITYTILVTNSGNVTLNNITVTDPLTGLNTTILSLAPGSSQTYTEVYTITQSDLDAGFVTNTATATDGVTTDTGSETVNAVQQPELTVTKTADAGTC
jgi:uncharacterized repeat protein (TIGR01451 family)